MKQFRTILGFELRNYCKNKVFIGTTVFICLVICVVMFFPRVADSIGNDADTDGDGTEATEVMLIHAQDEQYTEMIATAFGEAFPGYSVRAAGGDEGQIREQILSGEAECAFVFDSPTSYTYYVENLSLYDQNEAIALEVLQGVYRMSSVIGEGVTPERAAQIFSAEIGHTTEIVGVDQRQNFFYTYIMIFALYMVILLYGQMIATNVATEKSSRAMELLITSARPTSMMFGKVMASCIAGLVQILMIFGSAMVFYNLNREYWSDMGIIGAIFDIPPALVGYMVTFFILGFLIYAFMYGAVGSTVSKLEDINTAVMPVTLLFIAAFFVVMFSLGSSDVDNTVMKVCSFIPFTSPMSMFTRIAMSTVPTWEIALSVGILVVSAVGVGVLSARIYRLGVMLYGKAPKIGKLIRDVIKK